jgi:hypothetical protein
MTLILYHAAGIYWECGDTHLIEWDGVDAATCTIKLDGAPLGVGLQALSAANAAISHMHPESRVQFRYKQTTMDEYQRIFGHLDMMPFGNESQLREDFDNAMDDKEGELQFR